MYTNQDVQMLYEDIRASIARAAQLPDSEGGTFIFLTLEICFGRRRRKYMGERFM